MVEDRITLRLPQELKKKIRYVAAERETSINGALVEIISEWFELRRELLPISGDTNQSHRIE